MEHDRRVRSQAYKPIISISYEDNSQNYAAKHTYFGQILTSFLGIIRVSSTGLFDPYLKSPRTRSRRLNAAVCLRNLPEILTPE